MNFLVDEQLPPALAVWLTARGYAAEHATTALGPYPSDVAIAAHCERRTLVLISKDRDFVRLRTPDRFPLVRVRFGNISKQNLFPLIDACWGDVVRRLEAGERVVMVG